MTYNHKLRTAGVIVSVVVLMALTGCTGAGTGSSGSGTGGSCDAASTHIIEWRFSGSYADSVSIATGYVLNDGTTNLGDPNGAHIDPAAGTLLTETLPGCSGASINITMLDGGGDSMVDLNNVELGIVVDGSLADSVTLTGSDSEGTVLPSSGGLAVDF